jgi:hypothetical protein
MDHARPDEQLMAHCIRLGWHLAQRLAEEM